MALDASFLDELAAIVGHDHLRRENQVAMMDPGIDPDNLAAGLAIRPGSARDVAGVLSLCDRAGVAVVTHGGRTGLARAAVSAPGQVVLLTERFTDLEIDPVERVALVGAGVTLQTLQEACAAHGLSPGIDLASRGSATIGGMVSTNAGGMEAFRHGMMRQRLLGLEGVLADGAILSDLARVPKNNEGYDLRQLFCGAEGTLGVVTRVTMRLERADPPAQTVIVGCETADAALRIMRTLQEAGNLLLAEIMWRRYAEMVAEGTGLTGVLSFCEAPVYAIYSVAGEEDTLVEALGPLFEDGTIMDAVLAQSEREAADIWRIREDSFASVRQIPHPLWFDVSLPLSRLDDYVDRLEATVQALDPDFSFQAIAHLADGNLHLTVGSDAPFAEATAETITLAVEDGVKDAGGSISAEHGIGLAKLASLGRNALPDKIAVMRRMKAALDPNGIMNPGKVIPS